MAPYHFRTGWPWSHFQGRRGYLRRQYMKDGFCSISEEIVYVSSPNIVQRSTRASHNQVRTWWPWRHFQGHRYHLREWHMIDGFRSVSQEIFDVSSPNLLHRSIRAWRRPSLNQVTLTSVCRPQRSFKVIWNGFCSIFEELFDKVSLNLVHRGTRVRRRPR